MDTPVCTVLFATHQRRPTLMRCLDALEAQDVGRERLQVIVIDDGSTDGTLDALAGRPAAFGELVVLSQENLGPSVARQRGLAHATAPLTLFVNDDTILAPDAVRAHLEAHRRHPRSMILGTFDFLPELARLPLHRMLAETTHLFSYALMEDGDALRADLAATCNMSVPTAISRTVGFDPRFHIYAEDVDFALGVEAHGYTLRHCAAAVGWHDHRITVGSLVSSSVVRGVGSARLALKRGTAGPMLDVVRAAMHDEHGLRARHAGDAETLERELAACDPDGPHPASAYAALAGIFRIGNLLGWLREEPVRALASRRPERVPA